MAFVPKKPLVSRVPVPEPNTAVPIPVKHVDRLTPQVHAKLLAWYRDHTVNPDHADAAKYAGCTVLLATLAYTTGRPDATPVLRPISQLVDEEKEDARRRRALVLQAQVERDVKEMELARQDAIETRRQEGLMVRGLRGTVIKHVGAALRLAAAGEALAEKLAEQIRSETLAVDKNGKPVVSVAEKLAVLRELGRYQSDVGNLAKVAAALERECMGDYSTKLLGRDSDSGDVNDAQELMRSALESLRDLNVMRASK